MLFSVAVLMKCEVGESPDAAPLHEESIFLIDAANREEAREKARRRAEENSISYPNAGGQTVRWSLVEIVGAYELSDTAITDGVELHSRMFRDVAAYSRWIASVGE